MPKKKQDEGKGRQTNIEPRGKGARNTRSPVISSPKAAVLALEQIRQWALWIAAIQTAAIGGLAALLVDRNKCHVAIGQEARVAAGASFALLALALLFSSWVLSSVASIAIRLGIYDIDSVASSDELDIYTWPSFTWPIGRNMPFGVLMGVQHWTWVFGLSSFAMFCFFRFW